MRELQKQVAGLAERPWELRRRLSCTGLQGGSQVHRNLVIVDQGKEAEFVSTDLGLVIAGYTKKQRRPRRFYIRVTEEKSRTKPTSRTARLGALRSE